jgi:hypothetical protein
VLGVTGESVANPKKASGWLRAVTGVLAIGGGGVFLYDLVIHGFSSWLDGLVAVIGLYGLYLFGFFTLTGRLPASMQAGQSTGPRAHGDGDA